MGHLALDLSKSSTGWALWREGWEAPRYGHWVLGSEFSSEGQVYAKLHRNLGDLFKVSAFDRLYFEEPINPAHLTGNTSIATIWLLSGLAAHAQSFGYAKRCRVVKAVNVERWRKDFIGQMVVNEVRAGVRRARKGGDNKASATDKLKRLVIERCSQLGLSPKKNDEADAIGILTYSLLLAGITPPWLAAETLRPVLGEACSASGSLPPEARKALLTAAYDEDEGWFVRQEHVECLRPHGVLNARDQILSSRGIEIHRTLLAEESAR